MEREIDLPGGPKLTMILIPPGEFLMGSTEEERAKYLAEAKAAGVQWAVDRIPGEGPQHRVQITQAFYLGKYEVTQAQWQAVLGSNPSEFKDNPSHPVEQVSWDDLFPFLAKLNDQHAPQGMKFVLPTEAQWEYACRAGTTTLWYPGDSEEALRQYAWTNVNADRQTHAVGLLRRNAWGLHDMHGNVWEWCADWHSNDYYGQSPLTDPNGANSGSDRVLRGGTWGTHAGLCRSALRSNGAPGYRGIGLGFRLAATIDVAKLNHSTPPPAVAPFDAKQARAHQEAWAKHLGVKVEYENSIGMKFVLIPPGEFMMGSTPAEIEEALKVAGNDPWWQPRIKSEAPRHKVILTKPIYMSVYEVTQQDYLAVMGKNPSHFAATGAGKDAVAGKETQKYPVEIVSWNDAAEFCAKLSDKETLKPFYLRAGGAVALLAGTGYRLPTEAEWEFACRAGTTIKYWNDDRDAQLILAGWFNVNSGGRTHAAGELPANPFGLYDMHGNVWEWVQDMWEPTYYDEFAGSPAVDPNGPVSAGFQRVLRGGRWSDAAPYCRSASRNASVPTYRCNNVGFRVVLVADAVKTALAAHAPQ